MGSSDWSSDGGSSDRAPRTEFWSLALRYGLSQDEVSLDKNTFYFDNNNDGVPECDPLLAGRYLCEAVGDFTTSSLGYSLVFDNLNNRLRPSAGQRVVISQDIGRASVRERVCQYV